MIQKVFIKKSLFKISRFRFLNESNLFKAFLKDQSAYLIENLSNTVQAQYMYEEKSNNLVYILSIPRISWTIIEFHYFRGHAACSNFHEFRGQALNSAIFVDTLQ